MKVLYPIKHTLDQAEILQIQQNKILRIDSSFVI